MLQGERDIIKFLTKLLDKYKISYLLTGSFAGTFWGHPRATNDIDFLVEVAPDQKEKLVSLLKELGKAFYANLEQAERMIDQKSEFNVIHLDTTIKIDFWVAKNDEFEKSKFRRKVLANILGLDVAIVSAEDLILTKLIWSKEIYSEKHIRDCVGIVEVRAEKLDKNYLQKNAKKFGVEKLLEQIYKGEYF